MSLKQHTPTLSDLRPRLTVIGVGGAGCNAINNMIAAGLSGVDFVVANTDAQALSASSAEHRVQLGVALTEGLGAGSRPEIGEAAAEEAIEDLRTQMAGSHMVFIASGMGGGTGTGAAAVIARVAKELGILTVGIVTKPFHFEGTRRMRIADIGVSELKKYVDTLIVIPNQNLFRVANERTTFAEAFVLADQVLYSGVACIVDLIIKEGLINLDFADVRTVMSGMGTAMMGTGEASGERRAILAAEEAIANPLLDDVSLKGARGLLLSISGGRNLTLYEVDEAASRVREEVDPDANIIVGATFDESLGDRVRVSIVASGMMRSGEASTGPTGQPSLPPAQTAPQQRAAPDEVRSREFIPQVQPKPATASPVRPPFHQGEVEDAQRRLTAALQYTDTSEQTTGSRWAEAQGPGKKKPSNAAAVAGSGFGQDLWQAPGQVMIEEVAPHPVKAPGVMTRPQSQGSSVAEPHVPFTPEMTTDLRRAPRRMPDIDEFPAVGQREYRQRAAADGQASNESAPIKRLGLFERLAGKTRRAGDSASEGSQLADTSAHLHKNKVAAPRIRAGSNGGWPANGPTETNDQPVELPELISRDRK